MKRLNVEKEMLVTSFSDSTVPYFDYAGLGHNALYYAMV